jgi:hypothetical protein
VIYRVIWGNLAPESFQVNKNTKDKARYKMKPTGITFYPKTCTALLQVDPRSVESITSKLDGTEVAEGLDKKKEFHITLIGYETGEWIMERIGKMKNATLEDILPQIEGIVMGMNWSFEVTGQIHEISERCSTRETRRSLIVKVNLPKIVELHRSLTKMIGLEFDMAYPHITLYTTSTFEKNRQLGIGIYSEVQFRTKLNPISIRM